MSELKRTTHPNPDQDVPKRIKVGEPFPSEEELFGNNYVNPILIMDSPPLPPPSADNIWDEDAALMAAVQAVESRVGTATGGETMEARAYRILKETFGHDEFREAQKEVVLSIASGVDTMAVLPTGRGKSLCFQLPALLKHGVTFVVSPLLALMHDQVSALQTLKIPAAQLNSSATKAYTKQTMEDLQSNNPTLKIVYITPERTEHPTFRALLHLMNSKGNIAFFAVDEAHCISQWGHDFRPPFRQLNVLKRMFPNIALLALTASATSLVKKDIVEQLELSPTHKVFTSTFNRAEIHYEVRRKPKQAECWAQIAQLIKGYPPNTTGVVYCLRRKDCEAVAQFLCKRGIKAQPYHAGLSDNVRKATQNAWSSGATPVVCATIAFGMGIDKPDVRFVIHETLPKSVEGFYQESGRAGRDRQVSQSVIYYSPGDVSSIEWLFDNNERTTAAQAEIYKDMLKQVVEYCELRTCRRCYVLAYFGETADPAQVCAGTCDVCRRKQNMSPLAAGGVRSVVPQVLPMREQFRERLVTVIAGNMKATEKQVQSLARTEELHYYNTYPNNVIYRSEIARRIKGISSSVMPLFDRKFFDEIIK